MQAALAEPTLQRRCAARMKERQPPAPAFVGFSVGCLHRQTNALSSVRWHLHITLEGPPLSICLDGSTVILASNSGYRHGTMDVLCIPERSAEGTQRALRA